VAVHLRTESPRKGADDAACLQLSETQAIRAFLNTQAQWSRPGNQSLTTAFVARSGGIVESGVIWDGDVTIHALHPTQAPLAFVYCVFRSTSAGDVLLCSWCLALGRLIFPAIKFTDRRMFRSSITALLRLLAFCFLV